MICSSVNRARFICPSSHGQGSYFNPDFSRIHKGGTLRHRPSCLSPMAGWLRGPAAPSGGDADQTSTEQGEGGGFGHRRGPFREHDID
jgi:hypothetical protein